MFQELGRWREAVQSVLYSFWFADNVSQVAGCHRCSQVQTSRGPYAALDSDICPPARTARSAQPAGPLHCGTLTLRFWGYPRTTAEATLTRVVSSQLPSPSLGLTTDLEAAGAVVIRKGVPPG